MERRVPTFAINLTTRPDRKSSLIREFAGRKEFLLTVIPAETHEVGAIGLWHTIQGIVKQACEREMEYVLICEDDHVFTPYYSKDKLFATIDEAGGRGADVVLGGISWCTTCIPVEKNLYWVEKFSGLQFTVVFKKFFKNILQASFENGDAADYKISAASSHVYFIYPFISVQKDFGYSDVTAGNNGNNRVEKLFLDAANWVNLTRRVFSFYNKRVTEVRRQSANYDFDNISIPTYVIKSTSHPRRVSDIDRQFVERPEFDVRVVNLCRDNNVGFESAYRRCMANIIQQALADDDDVIIVCDESHRFTEAYSREYLISQIVYAHNLGAGVLCGGIDDFEAAIPVTKECFWISAFTSTPFIIFYKSVFQEVLRRALDFDMVWSDFFREITSNKMVLFPFVSMFERSSNTDFKSAIPLRSRVTDRLTHIYNVVSSSGVIGHGINIT